MVFVVHGTNFSNQNVQTLEYFYLQDREMSSKESMSPPFSVKIFIGAFYIR